MTTNGTLGHSPRITVYTTPACHWCRVAKRYLAEKNLSFREVDVSASRKARQEMVRMTGQSGVPVILVGEHAMVGWDTREFERLLRGGFQRR